jgi:hypothetical protein
MKKELNSLLIYFIGVIFITNLISVVTTRGALDRAERKPSVFNPSDLIWIMPA